MRNSADDQRQARAAEELQRALTGLGIPSDIHEGHGLALRDYGHAWDISPGVGGGYIALRRGGLSADAQPSGVSVVRCGGDLGELRRHLQEETRLERRARIPTRPIHS
ncbi:hypothetical protein HNP84_002887 [Thermocatellispora tengchongensis]|uniref:Uncharacterized protein n=1 Tax=Thermocatellispora tengchongensis TaxID=1073253 RepID=A0A840P3S9_9ACTN|nr:hypothetical protein [Thermocatellispora tengchongensis]MBB5133166.1 hypothetical protein [Thermocatellispora tengchongensis]